MLFFFGFIVSFLGSCGCGGGFRLGDERSGLAGDALGLGLGLRFGPKVVVRQTLELPVTQGFQITAGVVTQHVGIRANSVHSHINAHPLVFERLR